MAEEGDLMTMAQIIKKAEKNSGFSTGTNATLVATEHWNRFVEFLNWFGNPDPNSSVNQLAEQAGMTPNDLKNQMAEEARCIMFTRCVK